MKVYNVLFIDGFIVGEFSGILKIVVKIIIINDGNYIYLNLICKLIIVLSL